MQESFKGIPGNNPIPQPYMLYGDREQAGDLSKRRTWQDMEYFQSMYPMQIKQLQEYVVKACDNMDYKNSPMYDEYPDRVMVDQVCGSICKQIQTDGRILMDQTGMPQQNGFAQEMTNMDVEEVEIYELPQIQRAQSWGPPSGPPPWGPPPGPPSWGSPPRPPKPPRPGHNWVNDIVKILLLNEMHNRRCRSGICR